MELTQVRLIVSDFKLCFRFYRDILGLKPQFDDDSGPYAKFEAGAAGIALHDRAHLTVPGLQPAAGDQALVVLKVDDVDAYAAEIVARGAELVSDPTVMWERLRVAYLRDPEGNLIELQQWLATR